MRAPRRATRYDAVVSAAGDWKLPRPIRDALRSWRFSDATALLSDAEAALAGREAVADAAEKAGLIAPAALRLAFEDDDGFDDSTAETSAELDVIGRYVAAEALRPREITPILALGLWGQTPDAQLAEAREAFAKGDLEASAAAAEDAAWTWTNAESLGQSRAVSIGLIVLAILFGLARDHRHACDAADADASPCRRRASGAEQRDDDRPSGEGSVTEGLASGRQAPLDRPGDRAGRRCVLPATAPSARAAEELRFTADTTYRVDPDDGVVRVRIDVKVTNLKPNTVRRTAIAGHHDPLLLRPPPLQHPARGAGPCEPRRADRRSASSLDTRSTHRLLTVRMPNCVLPPVAQHPHRVRPARRQAALVRRHPGRRGVHDVHRVGAGATQVGARSAS